MTALEMKCPFCGADPGQSCTDAKSGEPYPPHRARAILAQDLRDAPALGEANARVAEARRTAQDARM